jgi:enamine deaminase RidA (YjgF/YER057c/UK114 family)
VIQRIQIGPRMSQAVVHGNMVYLAGQVAKDKAADITEQTRQCLEAVDALLAEAGTNKSQILTMAVYLADIGDFAAMNAVYDTWIDPANPPTRACVEAKLADSAYKVEFVAVATKG